MGQNADQLKREIADTRNDLGNTLDAIGDRVSPSRVIQRRKNRVTGALSTARDRVMGVGHATTNAISGGTHSLTETVKDGVAGGTSSAVGAVREIPHAAATHTQGSPLAAGAIAFGIGFIAAAAIPPSVPEKEMAASLTDRVEPLKESIGSAAKEMADHLKEPAMEAIDAVRGTAAEGAHAVQESAKEAAQNTKDEGQQAIVHS